MSQFFLRIDYPSGPEKYPLYQGRALVGRAPECDVVLDHTSVSRHHAALVITGDRVDVIDLQSLNGTFVNTQAVRGEVQIALGDSLTFGSVPGVVECIDDDDDSVFLGQTVLRRRADVFVADQVAVIDAPQLIRLLGEIARTLIATLTLPETLTKVVDLLFAHIRAERAFILMRDSASGTLVPVLSRWSDGRPEEHPAVSKTVLDTAMTRRLALVTSDALVDTRFGSAQSLLSTEVRSIMCAPLYATHEPIGALYADNTIANQFSEADLELFTALTNYSAVAIAQARMAEQLIEERRVRERLQRYHSPAVVDRILAREGHDSVLSAQELDISVLFADIVQFTTTAESMRPTDVATMLNTFFSRTVEAIFAEEGTVDKFMGDAVLAIFGAPVEQSDHASRAVRAAQAMRRVVSELNAEAVFPPIRVRYAVNSGVAIAGDIGSEKRQEYTVLGDVVNIAARLKEIAQPDQIVISAATSDRLRPPVATTELGKFVVRGRTGKVDVLSIDV